MRYVLATALAATIVALASAPASAVDPGSQLIGCDQADNPITISVTSHLDPSCTWTRGVEIVASDVVLDCQGANIVTTDRRTGILITTPVDVAMSNIVVRNCNVQGFLNNMRITREGFRALTEGVEYDTTISNVLVEDSTFLNSRGVGIFVDGYVTDVTLRSLHVEGAGSTGIYLEAGSKDCIVEDSEIVNNGFTENGPTGQFFEFGGVSFFFWGTGREGLAIDGSRFNIVRNNTFSGNAAGGIYFYKNCGEFVNERPERWWHRRYGADGNLIEGNTFIGGRNGVWIGARMSDNTLPMDCSDPQYTFGVVLDYADDNIIRDNVFQDVTYGVRVEDDDNVIQDNEFTGTNPANEAVVIGTRYRTSVLSQPVDGTVVSGNQATIAGNTHPYRWIYGHSDTTFTGNQSLGKTVGLCEGEPPSQGPFVMTVAVVPAEPPDPPPGDPPVLAPPNVLPPCSLACTVSVPVSKPYISIKKLDTPVGDDTLLVKGETALTHPFTPALDPVANGIGVVIEDASGMRPLDVVIPGGAYDRTTKVGWKVSGNGATWKYINNSSAPPSGITRVILKHQSKKGAGLIQFKVKGKRGGYPVDAGQLPLAAFVVLDPPTAETGQCGAATFPGPDASCTHDGRQVKCK